MENDNGDVDVDDIEQDKFLHRGQSMHSLGPILEQRRA
jgi:hypothetical protein